MKTIINSGLSVKRVVSDHEGILLAWAEVVGGAWMYHFTLISLPLIECQDMCGIQELSTVAYDVDEHEVYLALRNMGERMLLEISKEDFRDVCEMLDQSLELKNID